MYIYRICLPQRRHCRRRPLSSRSAQRVASSARSRGRISLWRRPFHPRGTTDNHTLPSLFIFFFFIVVVVGVGVVVVLAEVAGDAKADRAGSAAGTTRV